MSRLTPVADKGVELVLRWLRVLRDDLWTWRVDPLPPSVWLRWVPHGFVYLIAFGILLGDLDQLLGEGRLPHTGSALVAAGQSGAAVLALRRPVPALWLSLTATLTGAVLLRRMLMAGQIDGFSWPWTPWGIAAHLLVLLLLALRVPTRVSVEALAVTALLTYVLQGLWGAWNHSSTGQTALVLFAVAVVLGTALRGRREARAELVQQTTLTAEERARRTLLEERSRIARELHDVVAHHMSVISIQAQVAPHLVPDPTDELKENLAGIRQNAVEALTELRRVLDVLRSEHPAPVVDAAADGHEGGSGTAPHAPQPTLDRLRALVENTRAAGLTVTTEITGERRPLPPGVELSAYRIVQEALSNVLRHAPGATAHVALDYRPHELRVEVTNTRPEREAPPSQGAGHGLLGMRERAAMLGGGLTARPWAGGGYKVSARLPVGPPASAGPTSHHKDATA
ncbi:sensor histidine kinase [Streptomyces griseomycini]|uniref:histidine kinase n=1 Tax=Streptomyces griseomycini TaxID=66895 RepID=A0A7W7LY33_9ACTN|nr:sensor histidine kinase [Streptomyces griseomycini]MBB4898162.1 signal transduction histidine kinase [Streptomyces griseomycini]GGQ37859.1 two-component sensor histidine kinase [Streptomyces griseomycini]GGR53588.1 two-component sensor histidine kinase [Streptomyces griseomycini]